MNCLEGHIRTFDKNEIIYLQGESIPFSGIVLSGDIVTVDTHESGNEHDIQHFLSGELFGEAFACNINRLSNVDIISRKKVKYYS